MSTTSRTPAGSIASIGSGVRRRAPGRRRSRACGGSPAGRSRRSACARRSSRAGAACSHRARGARAGTRSRATPRRRARARARRGRPARSAATSRRAPPRRRSRPGSRAGSSSSRARRGSACRRSRDRAGERTSTFASDVRGRAPGENGRIPPRRRRTSGTRPRARAARGRPARSASPTGVEPSRRRATAPRGIPLDSRRRSRARAAIGIRRSALPGASCSVRDQRKSRACSQRCSAVVTTSAERVTSRSAGSPRPPDRLHARRAELARAARLRELVEAHQRVADADLAERPPGHVGVQHRRLRGQAVDAAVLTAAVRIDARRRSRRRGCRSSRARSARRRADTGCAGRARARRTRRPRRLGHERRGLEAVVRGDAGAAAADRSLARGFAMAGHVPQPRRT